eukprot:SAG22_NODE_2920_length_2102_cov_1.854718_2_plen_50_part_00
MTIVPMVSATMPVGFVCAYAVALLIALLPQCRETWAARKAMEEEEGDDM